MGEQRSGQGGLLVQEVKGLTSISSLPVGLAWEQVQAPVLVPLLRVAVVVCLAMSAMLFVEKVYMGAVFAFVKIFGHSPERRHKCESIKNDLETGNAGYPMVLVQIPMYNEKEVILPFVSSPSPFPSAPALALGCFDALSLYLSRSLSSLSFLGGGVFLACPQVYQLSIGSACGLSWPSDRIIIQVLDDSTDPVIKVCSSPIGGESVRRFSSDDRDGRQH